MQGGGGSAPQFNAQQASQSQTASNIQTAAANMYAGAQNQYTPYGNLIYTEGTGHDIGGVHLPEFSIRQDLSPSQQRIFDQTQYLQNRALGTASGVLNNVDKAVAKPLDFSGLQPIGDQTQFKDQAYSALTSRATEDLNKQMDAQKVQLANQGVAAGSEAYNRAFQPFTRATTDISNQALINSTSLAGQNIGQQQGIRNQQIQEMLTQHNQPLADYQALMGFGGGVQQPQWAPGINAQVAPTDMISPLMAQYQGQMNAYNQDRSSGNALMGSLFGLGGAVLGGVAGGPLGASIGAGLGGSIGKGGR